MSLKCNNNYTYLKYYKILNYYKNYSKLYLFVLDKFKLDNYNT